jgi:predicted lysophospholipase L1 biosynthesis ABC-type transport system permease subunit
VGLFALVGGYVTERTPEIGVRVALGAGRGSVLRFFLARGAILTVAGVACGLGLAALTTRFSPLHPTALENARRGPRRLAALLVAHLCPVNSLLAPCHPGASPGSVRRGRCTTGCQLTLGHDRWLT